LKYIAKLILGTLLCSTFGASAADFSDLNQLDEDDKQAFNTKIVQVTTCLKVQDFECAVRALSQAKKFANGSRDRTILQKAAENIEYEQQLSIRENARKKYSAERSAVEANAKNAEMEIELNRRSNMAIERAESQQYEANMKRQRANEEQSTKEAWASLGRQIQQRGNETAAMLAKVDRDTNAAYAETNRRLAEQARERDRARAEREASDEQRRRDAENERDAERRRVAERDKERANRIASDRLTIAKVQESKQALPTYEAPVPTLGKVRDVCPPGSSPARHSNGVAVVNPPTAICVQDAVPQDSASNSSASANARPIAQDERIVSNTTRADMTDPKKKVVWGPVKQEMIAICRQSAKTKKWVCNGSLDNQIIVDEPTLESALARQHCAGGTWASGGPIIDGLKWEVYACGHSLGAGDYDVTPRYGIVTAKRSYICPANQLGDGRCETIYAGQDKFQ
jgi:hypothetical protein